MWNVGGIKCFETRIQRCFLSNALGIVLAQILKLNIKLKKKKCHSVAWHSAAKHHKNPPEYINIHLFICINHYTHLLMKKSFGLQVNLYTYTPFYDQHLIAYVCCLFSVGCIKRSNIYFMPGCGAHTHVLNTNKKKTRSNRIF